jgi:hypothetical protein
MNIQISSDWINILIGAGTIYLARKVYMLEKRIKPLEQKSLIDENYADTHELLLRVLKEMRIVMKDFGSKCEDELVEISRVFDKYSGARKYPRHIYFELVGFFKDRYAPMLGEQTGVYLFDRISYCDYIDAYTKEAEEDLERQKSIKEYFELLVSICPQSAANEDYRIITENLRKFIEAYKPIIEKSEKLLEEVEGHLESRSLKAFKLENHPQYYNQLHKYHSVLQFLQSVMFSPFEYSEYLTSANHLVARAVYLGVVLRFIQMSSFKFSSLDY